MHKIILSSFLSFLTFQVIAQTEPIDLSNVKSEVTIKVSKKKKRYQFFSDSAPVTMADGSIKAISDVQVGEQVRTCRNGKAYATQVKQIDVYNKPSSSLTAIYLRPVDAAEQQQLVPALLLEATPHHRVQTDKGKKRMKQLSKNDILYHYDPASGIVSTWKVGAVRVNARKVNKAYNLTTEDGTYLIENVMVANN